MKTVIITGPPGCGKGTQAKLIGKYLGYKHVSTGDILRHEISEGTELGKLAKAKIDDGNFVPDKVACEMIKAYITKNHDIRGLVLDGFPRTINQCVEFDKLKNQVNIDSLVCICIEVDECTLQERLLKRKNQNNRPDDSNISIIKHRLNLYKERTKSVEEFYLANGNCEFVDGKGDVNKVFGGIKEKLYKYFET